MSSSTSSPASAATFDPFGQSFTLLQADGTPFIVTVPDLDDFINYSVTISINYAAQLGASLILLIVLLLLTKSDRRTAPIFFLNVNSLAVNFIRNLLQCLYFTGPFSETYAYFAQDYTRVPSSSYADQVAGAVFQFILLVLVELSLILQVHVVCITIKELHRRIIYASSAVVALLACGFRLALCIENSKAILSLDDITSLDKLTSATNIMTAVSICWFCAIFVVKLGFALHQRRKLGLRSFGPMQIIFIMGCQTLIIPAIFSILQYFFLQSMDSNVLTLVAIFLPLSSMWAAASSSGNSASSRSTGPSKRAITYGSGSSRPILHKFGKAPLSPVGSATTQSTASPQQSPVMNQHQDVFGDVEARGGLEVGGRHDHNGDSEK